MTNGMSNKLSFVPDQRKQEKDCQNVETFAFVFAQWIKTQSDGKQINQLISWVFLKCLSSSNLRLYDDDSKLTPLIVCKEKIFYKIQTKTNSKEPIIANVFNKLAKITTICNHLYETHNNNSNNNENNGKKNKPAEEDTRQYHNNDDSDADCGCYNIRGGSQRLCQ